MISVCGGSTIIRSNGIETVCHQKNPSNDVKYITQMKSILVKKIWKCTQNEKRGDLVKIIRYPYETVVLRMIYIYKTHKNIPTTPAACGATGSFVKRAENCSHPISSIGLGRQTTTAFLSMGHNL